MGEIDILFEMNRGFSALHTKIDDKIDGLRTGFQEHLKPCNDRFHCIEEELAVKKAVNEKRREGRDFWKYIIRACVVAISLGALTITWNIFKGHIDMVIK